MSWFHLETAKFLITRPFETRRSVILSITPKPDKELIRFIYLAVMIRREALRSRSPSLVYLVDGYFAINQNRDVIDCHMLL